MRQLQFRRQPFARKASTVDLAPVPDLKKENHKPVILDRCKEPVIPDAIPPNPGQISVERFAVDARIHCADKVLADPVADNALCLRVELSKLFDNGLCVLDGIHLLRHLLPGLVV